MKSSDKGKPRATVAGRRMKRILYITILVRMASNVNPTTLARLQDSKEARRYYSAHKAFLGAH